MSLFLETSKKSKIKVLITAIGGGGNGDQMLKSLRLAETDFYEIFGTDSNPNTPQSKLVSKFACLPLANNPKYLESLLAFCELYQIAVLIPGCEPELKVMTEHRDLFNQRGILLLANRTELVQLCMDKEITNSKLEELGFKSPKFLSITSLAGLSKVDFFPVVVKPAIGGGGSSDVYIAQNSEELSGLAIFLGLEKTVSTFFVQEYVGDPENEYTVGVLHDLDGNFVNSIVLRRHLKGGLNVRTKVKNRTGNPKYGEQLVISSGVSQGDIDSFDLISQQCVEIAEALESTGPLNIQCRFAEGKVYVFEINPRFSGTSSMRAMFGFNEADLLIRKHVMNEEIPRKFAYRTGTIVRSLTETIL